MPPANPFRSQTARPNEHADGLSRSELRFVNLPELPDRFADLAEHRDRCAPVSIAELYGADPSRTASMTIELDGLRADFSKQRVDPGACAALFELARACDLEGRRDAQLGGAVVNVTEQRAAMHTALRAPSGSPAYVLGHDVSSDVHLVLGRMADLAHRIGAGLFRGATGEAITTVVNIGIGGSDLGPAMAYDALREFRVENVECHFVSNVDPDDLTSVLECCDPEVTLFIISSKTFTTAETMANARAAARWSEKALGASAIAQHFVAVSTNSAAVEAFGISPLHQFGFWDWVGGRFSIDSAIGLALMIAIGPDQFTEFLGGMRTVDEHFLTAPLERNIPVLMGMIGVWNRNILDLPTVAVIPYSQDLHRFPAYLQQLEMESNGKCVTRSGSPVQWETAPVVWGEPGTNGQHAFFQLLHQGTTPTPVDFWVIAQGGHDGPSRAQHATLVANAFAQAAALAFGRTAKELHEAGVEERLIPHRTFPGNRPSTTFLLRELSPRSLGMMIALYEHKVSVQGIVWDINSFDQFGVELGKELAVAIEAELRGASSGAHDPATAAVLEQFNAWSLPEEK